MNITSTFSNSCIITITLITALQYYHQIIITSITSTTTITPLPGLPALPVLPPLPGLTALP